jgi:hypothetical protein
MKEATGELNMTVVTVVAIAAVAAFFYAFVWPAIKQNIIKNTNCASAYSCNCTADSCKCKYDKVNSDGTTSEGTEITCPNNSKTSGSSNTSGGGTNAVGG